MTIKASSGAEPELHQQAGYKTAVEPPVKTSKTACHSGGVHI